VIGYVGVLLKLSKPPARVTRVPSFPVTVSPSRTRSPPQSTTLPMSAYALCAAGGAGAGAGAGTGCAVCVDDAGGGVVGATVVDGTTYTVCWCTVVTAVCVVGVVLGADGDVEGVVVGDVVGVTLVEATVEGRKLVVVSPSQGT